MGKCSGVLLTGATGLLGRFLLRELLLAGHEVAVLARDTPAAGARERIDELFASLEEQAGVSLPRPVVLAGDLTAPALGLSVAERAWLGHSCRSVLHAGACVDFNTNARGEPWLTNVQGTEHLLKLCAQVGLLDLHHVSTAFVCGDRAGPIGEDDLDCGQQFHNDYEQSKCAAERLLRDAVGPRVTVYRPSVIVGDSQTGFTSTYHGPYSFLALGDRLARPDAHGQRLLPLRLPFTGGEPLNLVCVDWVAAAIRRILDQPWLHGLTYHLVARSCVDVRFIHAVARELLPIDGVSWAGPRGPAEPTHLEGLFHNHLHEYWPYRHGHPLFRDDNTRAALPDLPPPRIDRPLLTRLVRFAIEDHWGRRPRSGRGGGARMDCAHYLEQFFPLMARQSSLAGLPPDVAVGLDVHGPGGGRWLCRWASGELVSIDRQSAYAEVTYRLDAPTFAEVVGGRLQVQEAFFARRIDVLGNVEMGLQLAVLFDQFVREHPYPSFAEPAHVCACA